MLLGETEAMNRNKARALIERLKKENEKWLRATEEAFMDGIFSIIERIRVEKKKDFILELVQNADDCNSSEISFDLNQSRIIIQNNGDPFRSDPDPNKDNVFAICKLGKTTKGSGKIGFMGFGFRAVFEVCKKPEIYSNGFSFYFHEDMIVPHWIEHIPQDIEKRLGKMKGRGSVFVLPNLTVEIRHDIDQVLENLSPNLLLYLQHLKRIRIGQQILRIEKGSFPDSCVTSTNGKRQRFWKRYYSERLKIPEELRDFLSKDRNLDRIGKEPKEFEQICVTFETEQDGRLADKEYGGLYAFLPLADEQNTKFRFNIQADFSVDAGRRRLREPENAWNQWILANVHNCVLPMLRDYRRQTHLRTDFYRILPLDNPERPEYLGIVKKKIDDIVQQQDSILVKGRRTKKHPDGKYWVKPENTVIADPDVQKLFDRRDLGHYFGRRKFYVAEDEIDRNGMKYIEEIVKDELSLDGVLDLLKDSRWIFERRIKDRKRPEKWVADLILYLAYQLERKLEGKSPWDWSYKRTKQEFIGRLSKVKFLLTEDLKLRRPERIFLPPSRDIDIPRHVSKKYSIVNRKLVRYLEGKRVKSEEEKERREKGLSLLREIVPQLSPRTIVIDIINPAFSRDNWMKYSDSTLRRYTDFVRKHESCWQNAKLKLKAQTAGKERVYRDPQELYLGTEYGNEYDINTLYKGYESKEFISLDYMRKLARPKGGSAKAVGDFWRKFLSGIRAKRIPEIVEHEREGLSKQDVEKELAFPQGSVVETYSTAAYYGYAKRDYDFDSHMKKILTDCVNDKVKDSCQRLKILIKILDKEWDYYSKYLLAQYGWHKEGQWGRGYERLSPSSFASFLRDSDWVPTKDGKHLRPGAVALSKLEGIVSVPIIDYKITKAEFKEYLQDLGVQTKPTAEGAMALLKARVKQKENRLKKFTEIYSYLAQHKEEREKIRKELVSSPCIFLPNRKKKYWKISEVFWEGASSFLEWKTDMGKTYPELKDFFLNFLGVREKPSYEDYAEFLRSYLWKIEKLDDKHRASLGNVYHHLNYVVTTPELKRTETWASLKKGFKIWCEDGYWVEIDKDIFFNDNDKLHSLFKSHTDMIFAYIPEAPKDLKLKQLFTELGIKGLSETYMEKCTVSGEGSTAIEEYSKEIRRLSKYIIHFLKEKSPQTFERLNKKGALSLLNEINVRFAENIRVDALANGYTVPLGQRKSFYSRGDSENCLFLEGSLKGNDSSCFRHIGIALANAFGEGTGLETFFPYLARMEITEIQLAMQDYSIPLEEKLKIEKARKEPGVPKKAEQTIEEAKKPTEVSEPTIPQLEEPTTPGEESTAISAESVSRIGGLLKSAEQVSVISDRASGEEAHALVDELAQALEEETKGRAIDISKIYKQRKKIPSIRTRPSVRFSREAKLTASKNWKAKLANGERIYVEEGVPLPGIGRIKKLKKLTRKIVEVMGGNAETVNICIARIETDGYNEQGQLFFNATRKDSPFRWFGVVARELAYNYSRSHYPHVKAMVDLIARGLQNFDDLFPIFKESNNDQKQNQCLPVACVPRRRNDKCMI